MSGTRRRLTVIAALVAAISVSGCRSAGRGKPFAPLAAPTAEEALAQLRARADAFTGARSLMRVRATSNGQTQSFRAQLVIEGRDVVQVNVYSPIGTTIATIRAEGNRIQFSNRMDDSSWEGSEEDLARSVAFYSTAVKPAEMAMLLIGLPPRRDLQMDATPAGLKRVVAGDAVVTFDPPSFPARHVVVERGADRVEIDHLEIVAARP